MDWTPDGKSDQPLHRQLEHHILQRIQRGVWPSETRLPSERDIARETGLSRTTVRQAISHLVQQGVLDRVHGSGTYVRDDKLETRLAGVYSFAEQVRQHGLEFDDRILSNALQPVAPRDARLLDLEAGDQVMYLERLRFLDGQPAILTAELIPRELGVAIFRKPLESSLYGRFTELGITVAHAVDTLEAIPADPHASEHLRVDAGQPIMYVTRLAYTADMTPLHVGRNFIRGDLFRFRSDLASHANTIELRPKAVGGQ